MILYDDTEARPMANHANRTIFATHGDATKAAWKYLEDLGPFDRPDVETQVMPTDGGYCVQFYAHWDDATFYL